MNPNHTYPSTPEAHLLTTNEAAAFLKISRRTFLREVEAGHMPQPIRITPRRPRWDRLQLQVWIGMKAREQAAAHASACVSANGSKGGAA